MVKRYIIKSDAPLFQSTIALIIISVLLVSGFVGLLMYGFSLETTPSQIEYIDRIIYENQTITEYEYITEYENQTIYINQTIEDGEIEEDEVFININWTNTANIQTNHTVTFTGIYQNYTIYNSSLLSSPINTHTLIPFQILNGSILSSISFYIDVGGVTTYIDFRIINQNDYPDSSLSIFSRNLAIGKNYADWYSVDMDRYIDNGSYYLWLESFNLAFELGLATLNDTYRIIQNDIVLPKTPAIDIIYLPFSCNLNESKLFDVRNYSLQFTHGSEENYTIHIVSDNNDYHGILGTWTNLSYYESNLTLTEASFILWNNSYNENGYFLFTHNDFTVPLINYTFNANISYIINFIEVRLLIIYPDWSPFICITFSVNENIFMIRGYWHSE